VKLSAPANVTHARYGASIKPAAGTTRRKAASVAAFLSGFRVACCFSPHPPVYLCRAIPQPSGRGGSGDSRCAKTEIHCWTIPDRSRREGGDTVCVAGTC
jgi:hypothetical protein